MATRTLAQQSRLTAAYGGGLQLNAEIEHQTAKDSTVGSEKPLGERGAVMADKIGAAR
jgi:hypothetical protein